MIKIMENKKKREYLYITGIVLVFFGIMVAFCDIKSFWMDDLAQIDIALQPSLTALLQRNISFDLNPPLTHIMYYFWIRMVPYGTGWLKLLNIIFVALGTYICALIANKLYGEKAGVATAFCCAANISLVTLAAYTSRPYGFLFLISSLVMLLYMESRTGFSMKKNILFLIGMVFAVYTHYFAVLVCVCLFCCDIYLIIKKKLKWTVLCTYPIAAICYLPWVIWVAIHSLKKLGSFWPSDPKLKDLIYTICELYGNRLDVYGNKIFLIFGLIFIVGYVFIVVNKKYNFNVRFISGCILILPTAVIMAIYLFSKYVPGVTSIFVSRYFICVLPQMLIISGCGVVLVLETIQKRISEVRLKRGITVVSYILLFAVMLNNTRELYYHEQEFQEPFLEVANWLNEQEDVRDEDVLVFNTCYEMDDGWNYYITSGNKKERIEVMWYSMQESQLENVNKIYVANLHLSLRQEDMELLQDKGFVKTNEHEILPICVYER